MNNGSLTVASPCTGPAEVNDPAKLSFPFSRMKATDARDWDAIHAWAEELYGKLSVTVPA